MQLSAEEVKKWWKIIIEGYRDAAQFMTNEGIIHQRILPYSTLVIPLAAIYADIRWHKGEVNVGAAWPKIRQWYWCSVFSQRYSGLPEVVRTFSFRSDYLQEITSIRNAIYKGVLCLLSGSGAEDFGGGGKLNNALFHKKKMDHHHIFPTKALSRLPTVEKDRRTDTIVNRTLIGASVNRSISDSLPSEYLDAWKKKLDPRDFEEIIQTHAIDPSLLRSNRWDLFLKDRREKLRKLIESACGGIFQPFSEDINNLKIANPDELENDG